MRAPVFMIVAVLAVTPTYAACSKPQAPTCAVEGAFASAAEQDQCRKQMLVYKGGMEVFAQCVREEKRDDQPAIAELEHTLAEFNRRSRELPADDM
jgi:hypothetical protein